MSPSLESNGATLLIWTVELLGVVGQVQMGSAAYGTSFSIWCTGRDTRTKSGNCQGKGGGEKSSRGNH